MPDTAKRRLVMTIAAFSVMVCSYAQPRTLGAAFSYNGISLVYEHVLSHECFIMTDLRAELGEVFVNRTDIPGLSASVTANFILKSWLSANGNPISFFAGPGAAIGVVSDYHQERGLFFGLKGRIGLECFFSRKVSISVSLNPILGTHMVIKDDAVHMKYYKYGLLSSILPEIGIKYAF